MLNQNRDTFIRCDICTQRTYWTDGLLALPGPWWVDWQIVVLARLSVSQHLSTVLRVCDAHPEHTLGETKAHMKFCHRQRGYAKSLEAEGDEETKPIAAIISQASSYPSNQPTYLSSIFYIWTYYHPHQCDDERKNGNKFDISVVQNNIIYICIVEMLYLRRHTRSQYIYASAYINIYIHIHTYVDIYFAYIIIPP